MISPLRLKNVLYVPKLKRNLISISQLIEYRVAIVHVRDECKMISNYGNGHLIMIGNKIDDLWHLNLTPQLGLSLVNCASTNTISSLGNQVVSKLQRWYERLGHVNIKTLKQIARNQVVQGLKISVRDDFPICFGCAYGKHSQTRFPVKFGDRHCAKNPGVFFTVTFLVQFN